MITWICNTCGDRECQCKLPADTQPEQALDCITYVPEWQIKGAE